MTSRRALIFLLAALLAGAGCGDDDEPAPAAEPTVPTTQAPPATVPSGEAEAPKPPPTDKPSGPAESGEADPRLTALERAAQRTVRSFIAALDARDGQRACSLLVPGALAEVELPKQRGSCAESLEASIGYRDPRGLPVWESAEVARVNLVELDEESAKLVLTVVTEFADRDEPSIEDDLIYLSRDNGGWLIAKPSSTLYRAIGVADVPPSVLTPP